MLLSHERLEQIAALSVEEKESFIYLQNGSPLPPLLFLFIAELNDEHSEEIPPTNLGRQLHFAR